MSGQKIQSRAVSEVLQEQFAALTGDRNPMHMDAVAARRTQAGQPVVHGVHTLLWAMEVLAASGRMLAPLTHIKAKFLKWVYLNDVADLCLISSTDDLLRIQVEVIGMIVLMAEFRFESAPSVATSESLSAERTRPLSHSLDLSFEDLDSRERDAYVALSSDVQIMFPALSSQIGSGNVAEIAACSYVVGMEAPGLHSMFSKLDLVVRPIAATDKTRGVLHYSVREVDERFRKVRIDVSGSSVSGTLEAFVRMPPVQQAMMKAVAERVQAGEFEGMNALIIGGSRGLGELTAKLIAAGGGASIITYAAGKDEAENVAGQVRAAGDQIDVLAYDVRKPVAPQLASLKASVTHLFYFATNAIFRPKNDLVSPPILADFTAFYIQGFYDLCAHMVQRHQIANRKLLVYYPSSIAVEERPAGMTEYSMVKVAGELMCDDMNRFIPGLHIVSTRLPRLRTDQTTGVLPEKEQDPVDVLLPILRDMQALGKS